MRAVTSATEAILPYLRKGNLVVLESTSPPRTTVDLVRPILERTGLRAGVDFYLCYSPERVLPGQILRELIENAGRGRRYPGVRGSRLRPVCHIRQGRDCRNGCHHSGNGQADGEYQPRCEHRSRRRGFAPGRKAWGGCLGSHRPCQSPPAHQHPEARAGVGGHCISVDPWFFVESAPELTPLIYHARQVNDQQPYFVLEKSQTGVGPTRKEKIAALGLAYKPDVDDLRESPAVEVVRLLQKEGAQSKPGSRSNPMRPCQGLRWQGVETRPCGTLTCSCCWSNIRNFPGSIPLKLPSKSTARLVVDCVNGWDSTDWENAGFHVFRLGARK